MKTLKLKFNADAWYNGKLIYRKDSVHDVTTEGNFAQRWLKRGAEIVEEAVPVAVVEEVAPVVAEEVAPAPVETRQSKKFAKHAKKTENSGDSFLAEL